MTALTNIGSYLVRRLIDLVPLPVRRAARSSTMHAAPVGLGGGGTVYAPVISPADPNVMVVACDMGGLYLSRDAGQHWTLLDNRRVAQPAVVTEGSDLWQVRLGALADFDLYTPNLLYTIGPNRPLSSYDVTTGTWTNVPVTRDPDHPHLLNSSPSPAGPTVPRARLLFVTDVNAGGPGPYPRPAILVGLPGAGTNWPHDEAAATVKRDGTVTAVLERHGDGTTVPIEGRCMAVTACFDPGLEWAVPLLATRTALYSATDRVDATTFRRVGGGLPPLDQHLSIFDLTCAWYGSRHLYLTLVSDNENPEAGVYRTTDPQGNGWTRVEPGAASGLPAGVPFGPIAAAGPVRQAPGGNNVLSEKAAASVYVAAWTADKPYQRLYRSQDGGGTWSHVLNVGAASDNPGGAQQNLTAGGGWLEHPPFGPDFGGAARGLAVSAAPPGTVVFTNLSSLYVSTDAGGQWRQGYTEPDGATGSNHSIGLEVTTAWNHYTFPGPAGESRRHFICYSDIAGALGTYDDGGQLTWKPIAPQARSGTRYNTIYELAIAEDDTSESQIWAAAAQSHDLPYAAVADPEGGILFSSTFGDSWTDRSGTDAGELPHTAPVVSVVLDPAVLNSGRRLWAALYGDGVWKTENSGSNWSRSGAELDGKPVYRLVHRVRTGKPSILFCCVSPPRPDADGELWESSDDGTTWTPIPLQLPYADPAAPKSQRPASRLVRDFAVHPTDPDTLFVCTAGSWSPTQRMGGVWKTTDRGTTWRHVDVLDNNTPSGPGVIPPYDPDFVRAFGAFFDRADPRRVYVTTSAHGTWVSQRAGDPSAGTGTDWEQLTSLPFLPNQRVTDDPTSGATYVTTFGAGVWRLK